MRRGIVAVLVVLALAGAVTAWWWVGRPGGLPVAAEDADVTACLEAADLSLAGVEDWSIADQREFLTEPGALDCVARELDEDDLPSALGIAFPEIAEDDGPQQAREGRKDRADVLMAYVSNAAADRSTPDLVDTIALTLRAFDEIDSDWYRSDDEELDDAWAAEGYHRPIALALYEREHGELPGYAEWLTATGHEDSTNTRILYLQEQQNEGTPFGDEVRELRGLVDEAHDEE